MSEPAVGPYEACTPSERTGAIEQLGALLSATQAELLRLIAVSDGAEDWRIDGATGMAPWLVAALRVSSQTAKEWVDAATALRELPTVHDALAAGVVSWEQVRPVTRFATADEDTELAEELPGCTVAQLERMARNRKPRKTAQDREAARVRRFRWRPDRDNGGFRYSGFLPADRGEPLNKAIERQANKAGPDAETGLWDPFESRAADALVEMALAAIGADTDPDTCLVVVHVDDDVIDGTAPGNGTIADVPVSAETVRRLLCDCKVEFSIDGPDGTTIGIARASRNPPRWLRRRIAHRDGTCRFPGCGRVIRHRHHVRHWTRNGPTNADNLIGLCWHHHHLVHEGGWTIEGNPEHDVVFCSPTGRKLTSRPPPVLPDVKQRAFHAAGLV